MNIPGDYTTCRHFVGRRSGLCYVAELPNQTVTA